MATPLAEIADYTGYQEQASLPTPEPPGAKVESMKDADQAVIVVSRKTVAWAGAALFALFGGGQVASLKFADTGSDQETAALSARVDALSTKIDSMVHEMESRDRERSKLLTAILVYQIEVERYQREQRGPNSGPRSPELEAAAARLKELASR
jgi:hypothetical protein